ncbi:pyridoxamine kinase [Streptococcus caviae]|uniref:pyridoxamine kinase n=1 Tax=Streptococcus sp. 'caviae' TaxID=1915004 RepID=UPI00094B83F5|nr:pyridoxamine kinase [Streptococcus sp. 'caviae']OLN83899.1 pyridoxamine kinase [Streptococcus sp. 'caviae']
MIPRLLVANDLPGLGKVALAGSLPIMAACQIETAILPTVLLSSHTGGFTNIQIDDYTAGMAGFLSQWQELDLVFDGLVTGYLKNKEQIALLIDFAEKKELSLFVDPIMGDKGHFYQGFDQAYARHIRRLCQKADVIIPNLTEAAFLTGTAYLGERYEPVQIENLLRQLADLGPKIVVLTGVSFEKNKIGLVIYQKQTDEIVYVMAKRYPQLFYGTGDIVTAILASCYFHGIALEKSARLALKFLDETIQSTLALNRDLKYGLCYEPHLLDLIKQHQLLLEEIK